MMERHPPWDGLLIATPDDATHVSGIGTGAVELSAGRVMPNECASESGPEARLHRKGMNGSISRKGRWS